jgi:peroxiredoxin
MLIRLSLLALLFAGCASAPAPAPPPAGRGSLPPVELVTLDGQPMRLQQAVAGRVALVAVWATWCEACASELESLERLHDRAGAHGAVVVAVAVGEKRSTVAAFVARHGLRYFQLVDEEYRLADALGQKRVPATLVIDRSGQIVFTGGAFDGGALAAFRTAVGERVASR